MKLTRRGFRPAAVLAAVLLCQGLASATELAPLQSTTVSAENAQSQRASFDQAAALADSQRAIGNTLGDYTLRDSEDRPVRLADLRGKPLLISFVYTGCFQVCPTATRSLKRALESALGTLGTDSFNVVSIGFNQPFDSPQALRAYAQQHGVHLPNWRFLSPDSATLAALARDVGFRYTPVAGGFDHVTQVTIIDGNGVVVGQVYGERFALPEVVEPLKTLLAGRQPGRAALVGLAERVRLLCTYYDPVSGQYRFRYAIVLEIAGGLTGVLTLIVLGVRASLSNSRALRRFPARWESGVRAR